jgi:hypothetical protein
MLSAIAGMIGTRHHAQLFLLRWVIPTEFFCECWPGTLILPVSASHITGMSKNFLRKKNMEIYAVL